jgi:glycosyltransferase involved in cell wall biosynthesis
MKISVIVPVYNEGESVRVAYDRIVDVFADQLPQHRYEVIFVDDGSIDDSFFHLSALAATHGDLRVIKFAQNAGSHMAIRAGLEHATGDAAVFLACDMQDPPEIIPKMLAALRPPVRIVWAVRDTRNDRLSTKLASRVFFTLARLLVSKNLPPSGASMFMLGPDALRAVPLHRERNLTLEGLFATMGLAQAQVPYDRRDRDVGTSKWTLGKKLKLFADFFVGYSYAPIRLMSYVGMSVAALGFIYVIMLLVNKLQLGTPVEGWTSLMVVVLIVGGVQMTMLGIIGEYVWRGLDETRRRPRYIVEQFLNAPALRPDVEVDQTELSFFEFNRRKVSNEN